MKKLLFTLFLAVVSMSAPAAAEWYSPMIQRGVCVELREVFPQYSPKTPDDIYIIQKFLRGEQNVSMRYMEGGAIAVMGLNGLGAITMVNGLERCTALVAMMRSELARRPLTQLPPPAPASGKKAIVS